MRLDVRTRAVTPLLALKRSPCMVRAGEQQVETIPRYLYSYPSDKVIDFTLNFSPFQSYRLEAAQLKLTGLSTKFN